MFSELTSKIAESTDGAQAVAAFARHRPDWTIMGIALKGVNGLEAPRRF
jgi:CheY-like chemotaxis protein